jgi:hypothetical protein
MFVRKGWDTYVSDAVERPRGFAPSGRVAFGADLPPIRIPGERFASAMAPAPERRSAKRRLIPGS